MEEQAKDGGRETEEEPPREKNKEAQQNVNVTGVTGGSVNTANIAGIVYGGMGNTVTEPDHQKKLSKRTKEKIEVMTAGMIRVSAVDEVVNKMNTGQQWITITGNAGDGKTTLGYLVMKEFLQKNVKVFTINEPEEYDQIADMAEDRVIMFDDRFGEFSADQQLIKRWRDVIKNIVNIKFNERDKPSTKVIFLSRRNVVKESQVDLGHLKERIFEGKSVVDLSSGDFTDELIEERLKILEYHLKKENVTIPDRTQRKVCNVKGAHGFPHCCYLFSVLKAQQNDLDIVKFFESPLKFLDITTRYLYKNNCKTLFKQMIKNDGQLGIYNIEDAEQREALLGVVREQEGSYITVWRDGICQFAHPSVYESVLNVVNDNDPLYCVKYATLSVIRQKMFISISDAEDNTKSASNIIVKPIPAVLKTLAERFREEILEGNYSVFRHRLCQSREFCELLVSCCVHTDDDQTGSIRFINKRGKEGNTMLWTALRRGRMTAVQVLVKAGADVSIQDKRGRTPLQYLCQLKTAADDIDGGDDDDDDDDSDGDDDDNDDDDDDDDDDDSDGDDDDNDDDDDDDDDDANYPCIDMDTIRVIVNEGGGDINICDQFGQTPLHYLFKCRAMTREEITWIITGGKGDLGKCEQNKTTPLHYLCAYSSLQRDSVDLVIREGKGDFNKGDEHGTTPLHYVCHNTNIGCDVILQIVNTANGDINKRDDNGISPLHVICKGSHQMKYILTLINQVDKADMYGNTPLHFLCQRRGINAEKLQEQLNQIPEADMKKQNSLGHTPWEYLNDQDDSLPWRDGMIDRSPADLVMCRFVQGEKWIVVKAPAMTLNSERVHSDLQVEDFSRELNNMARSGYRDRPDQFRRFRGTCSSPVPVPPSPSPFSLPTYWETHSRHTGRGGVGDPLLQMGVVEDHLDEEHCVSLLHGSVCVSVEGDCLRHVDRLCIQVWRVVQYRADQVGECVTLPLTTRREEFNFKFGLVLDVGRGRVGFIDVERGEILGKVDQKFTEWVFPMFFVTPFGGPTRMRLVSGREISINDRKIQLIQQVLSD